MATLVTQPAGKGIREALERLRHALPQGRTLPDEAWRRRHRALLLLLWGHAIALPIFGIARGYGVFHSVEEGLSLAALAALAILVRRRKRAAAALVALGLITSSALLVHLWGGVIEAHFHFFVMIVVLSLYEDWLPFLLAAGYVVLHHGLTGALDPGSVYNHAEAVAHPWTWAAIHGLFVTAAGIGAVVAWRLNEEVRAETGKAYRRAQESEERFKGAFDNAPIGMALARIDPARAGRFFQVNHALCEITGHPEEDLLKKSFGEITHPDDREASAALFKRLVEGELSDYSVEKRYLRVDGQVVWTLVNVSLVHDGLGKPVYAIGQVQDITRQKRAQEQLAYQAYHDSLTGLPNRRKLMEDLEERMALATREEPLLLMLLDLDGFKTYNDSFGHPAGDVLLSRLARRLEAALGGRGDAYRMGGDEFCVLVSLGMDGPDPIVAAVAALSESGDAFRVTGSFGSVLLPIEAATQADALRKADMRMYARKGRGRASAGRQATDALTRALSERSPDLGSHLHDVTDLCNAVAQTLDIPEEETTPLLAAARLHDVGKLAIPDAILNKPAPLDEAEWDFMRTHTVIGERILAAAPSLARAGKLVRSSHERFDGSGYPDGLAGDEIPLGSRIIAVCDAYNAMTSDRPYRTAMSAEVALGELRRASGSQFDPAVVEAFLSTAERPASAVPAGSAES